MNASSDFHPLTSVTLPRTAIINFLSWLWPSSKDPKSQTKSPNKLWALLRSTHQALMTQINATYNNVTTWLQSVFFYHHTFIQILIVTDQWGLFIATIAGILVESLFLNKMMMITESAWEAALNEKNPLLWSIGMRYLRIFVIITALELFFEFVQAFFHQVVSKTLKTKVVEKLDSKHTFRSIQEKERVVNNDPSKSGLARAIADAKSFLSGFIELHREAFLLVGVMVSCALSLAEVGLLYEGAKVFAICVAAGTVLIYRYTNKESNQNQGAQHESFDRTINNLIVEENRAQNLPNWRRVYTRSAHDNINEAFRIAKKNILSNRLLSKIFSMTTQISDPIFILTMFLTPYLTGGMAFAQLAQIVTQLRYLVMACGAIISSAPYLGKIANFAENTSRVINDYFLNKLPEAPTHHGLIADGELNYKPLAPTRTEDVLPSASNVLTFFAEVKSVATTTNRPNLLRRYGTKDEPLDIEPNTLVSVLGVNGAGKSVFLDALDPRFEFGIGGDAGKDDNGFCLHCEQKIIPLPPRVDRSKSDGPIDSPWAFTNKFNILWKPNKIKSGNQSKNDQQYSKPNSWTVAQIIAMLWPQELSEEIENINEMSFLNLQRGEVSDQIPMAKLLECVDNYRQDLNLSTDDINKDFNDMSDGQQCKLRLAIYFAMAECIKPRLFMIDEPYNNVDSKGVSGVRQILSDFKKKQLGTTTFVVTHDDNKSNRIGLYDRVIMMRSGEVPIVYNGVVGKDRTLDTEPTGFYKYVHDNGLYDEQVSAHMTYSLP